MHDPAAILIACVRKILIDFLATSRTEKEISAALQVSAPQAKMWLQKFIEEGLIERRAKPVRYALKEKTLL